MRVQIVLERGWDGTDDWWGAWIDDERGDRLVHQVSGDRMPFREFPIYPEAACAALMSLSGSAGFRLATAAERTEVLLRLARYAANYWGELHDQTGGDVVVRDTDGCRHAVQMGHDEPETCRTILSLSGGVTTPAPSRSSAIVSAPTGMRIGAPRSWWPAPCSTA